MHIRINRIMILLVTLIGAHAMPALAFDPCYSDAECGPGRICGKFTIGNLEQGACVDEHDRLFPLGSPGEGQSYVCSCLCGSGNVRWVRVIGGSYLPVGELLWYPIGNTENRLVEFNVLANNQVGRGLSSAMCESYNGYRCAGYVDDLAALHRNRNMIAPGVIEQCQLSVRDTEELGNWWSRLPHQP